MAFVKLDTGILNSTLWIERDQREVFITALLMAEPREFEEPIRQIKVGEISFTDFEAPPGWYGFVPAASVGIIRRAGVDMEAGMEALRRMGEPEIESRSKEFEGRRMIRIDGGFLILNYMKYRDKDHTAALRQQRLRDRRKALQGVTRDVQESRRDDTLPSRNITQSEADAEPEVQKHSRVKRERPPSKTSIHKSRHAEFKEAVRLYWVSKNPGEMPWGPAEARQLDQVLKQAPEMTLELFKVMLRNRYKSNVNHGDRPSQWLFYIASYGPAPVDRFNKPIEEGVNGSHQQSVPSQRNKANRTVLAEIAIDRGLYSPPRDSGPNSEPLPQSGSDGCSTGVHGGSRTVGPEILPPER